MVRLVKQLAAEEGSAVLYKGLTARLTSSIPATFLLIVSYETVKRFSLKDEYREEVEL